MQVLIEVPFMLPRVAVSPFCARETLVKIWRIKGFLEHLFKQSLKHPPQVPSYGNRVPFSLEPPPPDGPFILKSALHCQCQVGSRVEKDPNL